MKQIILFLIMLFLLSSYSYSELLDDIRINVINTALLSLPEREKRDILKMRFAMTNTKFVFSLTDVETAYFIYKWIAENIEYDCSPNSEEINESGGIVYKKGKGSSSGISDLFKIMTTYLYVGSGIISGNIKVLEEDKKEMIKIKDYHWNYILINGTYYLIDVSNGAGMCVGDKFIKYQRDFYFATNPDIFIRTHFPEESKWQLLPKNITKEQFNSMVLLTENFYLFGFNSISPNTQIINGKKETQFILSYDKNGSVPENAVGYVIYSNGEEDSINYLDYKNEDGTIRIIFDLSDKKITYFVIGSYYLDRGISIISVYKINHSS